MLGAKELLFRRSVWSAESYAGSMLKRSFDTKLCTNSVEPTQSQSVFIAYMIIY